MDKITQRWYHKRSWNCWTEQSSVLGDSQRRWVLKRSQEWSVRTERWGQCSKGVKWLQVSKRQRLPPRSPEPVLVRAICSPGAQGSLDSASSTGPHCWESMLHAGSQAWERVSRSHRRCQAPSEQVEAKGAGAPVYEGTWKPVSRSEGFKLISLPWKADIGIRREILIISQGV